MLLLSEKLMSCCAAGTNGCLNLRRSAAAPDGRVSAEWSRCRGAFPTKHSVYTFSVYTCSVNVASTCSANLYDISRRGP